MCDHKEKKKKKTVGNYVVGFKSRINQHISDSRTVTSTCNFPIKVYHCAMKNKCLKEPFSIKYNDETKRQSAIRVL